MERLILDMLVTGLPTVAAFAGIYLMFRILNDFDLTVEGSITTGAAVSALLVNDGMNPWLAILLAGLCGAMAGVVSGALHLFLKIPLFLAGILMSLALFSVNLRVMDTPTISLLRATTIFTPFKDFDRVQNDLATAGLVGAVIAVALIALVFFLRTEVGLALRAMGINPVMARANGVNTAAVLIITLMIANGLTALSGALLAQQQGYAEVNMGAGTLAAGAASILLGELILNPNSSQVVRAILAVLVGALLYRFILVFALRAGLPPTDLKLVTAATLVAAIVLQMSIKSARERSTILIGRLRAMRQASVTPTG